MVAAGTHLSRLRRFLAVKGRPMVLRRILTVNPQTFSDVTFQGFLHAYRPEEMAGDIRQGDANVWALNDEITAAAWPAPVRTRDVVVTDGRTWTVQGAQPLYEGPTLIGYAIWIRGGQ